MSVIYTSKVNITAASSVFQADLPAEAVPQLLSEDDGLSKIAKKQASGGSQSTLNVCIVTADFWGLAAAGGTATAYHLLAAVLAKEESLNVSCQQCSGQG